MSERVVVVGAGIIGLAIGHRLARSGWKPIIMDPNPPCHGASAAALGSLTPYSDDACTPVTRELARNSVAKYPEWLDELYAATGIRVSYSSSGLFEIALSRSAAEQLATKAKAFQAAGLPVRLLPVADARALEPHINPRTAAVLFYEDEPSVDLQQLLLACESATRAAGCVISQGQRVHSVVVSDGEVAGVQTQGGITPGRYVVIAAGDASPSIAGVPHFELQRVRGEVIEVAGAPGMVGRHLYSGDGFITPRTDGRLLLGSTYDVQMPCDDERRDTVSVGNASLILRATQRMVPAIANFQIRRVWKGWRARTADHQPILGPGGPRGMYFATGLYGLGITLAPAVADLVSESLSDPNSVPRELLVDRFSAVERARKGERI